MGIMDYITNDLERVISNIILSIIYFFAFIFLIAVLMTISQMNR